MIIQYEKHKMQMEWPTEEAWAVKQEDMGTTIIDWIQKGKQRKVHSDNLSHIDRINEKKNTGRVN